MAKTTTKAAPKKKAAKKEEVKQEQVATDYSKFDYRPSDVLEVKASHLGQLRQALQIAVQGGTKEKFPSVLSYVAVNSGVEVDNPTKEAIESGQVRPILSLEKTFKQDNLTASYEPWVSAVAQALEVINEVHMENVDAGKATERAILQKEAEEAKKKAQEAADKSTDPDA